MAVLVGGSSVSAPAAAAPSAPAVSSRRRPRSRRRAARDGAPPLRRHGHVGRVPRRGPALAGRSHAALAHVAARVRAGSSGCCRASVPDSELSRLNRERALDDASDELLELTELALDARERTGGRFDPTLHDALVAAGYDRTFAELPQDVLDFDEFPAAPAGGGAGTSASAGGASSSARAPRSTSAASPRATPPTAASRRLAAFGPALVNAGGDLAVSGPRAEGAWPVGVDVPSGTLTLALDGRRPRHLGPRPPPLAARRRGAPSPDRPVRPSAPPRTARCR